MQNNIYRNEHIFFIYSDAFKLNGTGVMQSWHSGLAS